MRHITLDVSQPISHDAIEWRPDIDRLRKEIDTALGRGQADDLAVAEAECWMDLIDAELSARRGRTMDAQVNQLKLWRAELAALIQRAQGPMIDMK